MGEKLTSIQKIQQQLDREKAFLAKKEKDISKRKKRIADLEKNAAAEKRKKGNRKKILVGALVLHEVEISGEMDELMKRLDKFLVRENDRIVFDLPPKK